MDGWMGQTFVGFCDDDDDQGEFALQYHDACISMNIFNFLESRAPSRVLTISISNTPNRKILRTNVFLISKNAGRPEIRPRVMGSYNT